MDRPAPDEVITARNVDLSSCDRELIQYPEAIQPHGVMLAVDEQSGLILHASANAADLFGGSAEALLGKRAERALGWIGQELTGTLRRMALDAGPVHVARESFVGSERGSNMFAHRSGGLVVLELERAAPAGPVPLPALYAELRGDIARLQATEGLDAFFDLAVQRIRSFTGYDRVMAYRFDEDGSGEVVAEARRDDIEAYLGLHYPASDIPAPARRMFSLSWIRHLPDVDYKAVPLLAARSPLVTGPVDMSYATLRSVSVMYTDYLRNMGVRSTMVMPLMKEGRLWGLISAMHHQGPMHIAHETRMAAEFLSHSLSLLMSQKEDAERFARVIAMRETTTRLVEAVTPEPEPMAALGTPALLALLAGQVEAGGAAVVSARGVARIGATPEEPEIAALAAWLAAREEPVFATDRLPALFPPAEAFAHVASGVLAARLLPGEPDWLLWFRPEQLAEVTWAGDPHKPVEVSETDGALRLRPRGSFALWRESVRNRSTRWQENERDAVAALRRTLAELLVGRNAPEPGPAQDSFAAGAMQEMRQQLRGIEHLAAQLRRRQGTVLDAEGQRQVATILRIAQRTEGLLDALIDQARIGTMAREAVDMDALADAVLRDAAPLLEAGRIEVRRPTRLGLAQGQPGPLREVLECLVGNAIRYNDKPRRWIELGALPGTPARYYVRDNGAGIAEADQALIFRMFHRLHGGSEGSAGIGLAFAARIVEQHGGRIWVESRPGEGACFWFTLAPEPGG